MKKTTLLSFFILVLTSSFAQSPNWIWSTSATGDVNLFGMCLDNSGNIISAGNYTGSMTIGSTNVTGAGLGTTQDIHIEKYDSIANLLWLKTYGAGDDGEAISSVCTDNSGNIYSLGYFASDSITFGSTKYYNGLFPYGGFPTMDVFILKHDPAGNLLWSKKAGGWKNEFPGEITTDNLGNIYITGSNSSSSFGFDATVLPHVSPGSNREYFVMKMDAATGSTIWAKSTSAGTGADWGFNIVVDAFGNVYTSGKFDKASVTFGSTTLTNAFSTSDDIFFIKYDPLGNVLWAQRIGGADFESPSGLLIDENNNLVLTGSFGSSSITIGATTLTNSGAVGTSDIFIAKFSPSGTPLWAKKFGGTDDERINCKYDSQQNIIMAGTFVSPSITFGSTLLTNTGAAGTFDLYVVKMDSIGNVLWAKTTPGSESEIISRVAINSSDKIIIGGTYSIYSSISFGPDTYTSPFVASQFIAKLNNIFYTTITGNVKDVGVNFSTRALDRTNLSGCIVRLYQGTTLLSTQTTNATGDFSFTGLTSTNYKIVATYTSGYSAVVTYLNLDPGNILTDIPLPYTLIGQANNAIDSLDNKLFTASLFYNLVPLNTNASGYNEATIQSLKTSWQNIPGNLAESIVNSFGRLIVAQRALNDFSNDASEMISETAVSAFDFGENIYSVATIKVKIKNYTASNAFVAFLESLVDDFADDIMTLSIDALKTVVLRSMDCVDERVLSANVKAKLEGVMDMLVDIAESENPDDFVQATESQMVKDLIVAQAVPYIYSKVYVNMLTQTNVNSTSATAGSYGYTGVFDTSYDDVHAMVLASDYKTDFAAIKIGDARDLSEISSSTADLAAKAAVLTSAFDGGTVLAISAILKGISVGSSANALSTSVKRIARIKDELLTTTYNSFHDMDPIRELPDPTILENRAATFLTAKVDYNSQLSSIGSDIVGGLRWQALSKMDSLLIFDSIFQFALNDALMPIYIAAPYATNSIVNFDSIYNLNVIENASLSMTNRQSVNFNLIGYIIDSTNSDVVDSLSLIINETVNANNLLETALSNMTDSISTVPVSAHISVTSKSVPKPMQHSSVYPVVISYKNYGTVTADSVFARLELFPEFTCTQDSVYIGSIPVGGTGNVTYNITSPSFDTISYFTVVFYSTNANSDGVGASLLVHDTNSVSVSSIVNMESSFNVFPNPFNGQTQITYSLDKNATIEINVYNVLGENVAEIYNGKQVAGNYNLKWNASRSMKSGIYFIRMNVDNKTSVKKIVLSE